MSLLRGEKTEEETQDEEVTESRRMAPEEEKTSHGIQVTASNGGHAHAEEGAHGGVEREEEGQTISGLKEGSGRERSDG